jgi:hypothetical protein
MHELAGSECHRSSKAITHQQLLLILQGISRQNIRYRKRYQKKGSGYPQV